MISSSVYQMLPAISRFACSTNDALERTCGTDSFATNIYGCLVHNAHDTPNNSKAIFTNVFIDDDSNLLKQNIAPFTTIHWSWAEFTAKLEACLSRHGRLARSSLVESNASENRSRIRSVGFGACGRTLNNNLYSLHNP